MSKGRQTLIGCGLGCLALALLAIGSCVGLVTWLNRPGDVLEPGKLLSAESTGYVEWTLRLEDPGTKEFFELILGRLQEANEQSSSSLPAALIEPLRRMQQKRNEKKIRRIFPTVLVWTVEPQGQEADDHVLSASLRGLDHQFLIADWILGLVLGHDESTSIVRHRGEKIYLIDRDAEGKVTKDTLPVFIHSGDLFFTTDEASARRTVDRLKTPTITEVGPALSPWLDRVPTGSLRGALSNQRGEVWRAWSDFLDEDIREKVASDLRQALQGVHIGGGFTPEGSFGARLTFHFQDADQVQQARDPIRDAIEELLDDSPAKLSAIEAVGTALHCDLEITNIPESLGEASRRSDR